MDELAMSAETVLTRRSMLQQTSLLTAGAVVGASVAGCADRRSEDMQARGPLRIGMVTDVHYADKESGKTRYYRASLAKLTSAITHFNTLEANLVVQLGDLIDAADSVEQELGWLDRIDAIYAQANCPRHYVLGNHCVQTLTKAQFLARCGMSRSFYSFDAQRFHFIVLNACFRQDGEPYGNGNFEWTDANVPAAELTWLASDLKAAHRPTVVFVHQRLDVDDAHGIRNRAEVRGLLEGTGLVRAVFQGHNHVNDLREINGVAYCTLAAMVEGDTNAYGLVTLHPNGAIRVDGYGRQSAWTIGAA